MIHSSKHISEFLRLNISFYFYIKKCIKYLYIKNIYSFYVNMKQEINNATKINYETISNFTKMVERNHHFYVRVEKCVSVMNQPIMSLVLNLDFTQINPL